MLYKDFSGILYICLLAICLILLSFLFVFIKNKLSKTVYVKWYLEAIVWAQATIIYSVFIWYWALLIECMLFVVEIIIFRKKSQQSAFDKATLKFAISLFFASQINIWLPTIYELLFNAQINSIIAVNAISYMYGFMLTSSIVFLAYHVGIRPFSFDHRLEPPEFRHEDKMDKFIFYADLIVFAVLYIIAIVFYSCIFFTR